MHAVVDGEIICLGPDGRRRFYDLLFRREWPSFYAFDLLALEHEAFRDRPLIERKRRLNAAHRDAVKALDPATGKQKVGTKSGTLDAVVENAKAVND
jgi:ATP-dependent DNA ligase